MAATAVVVGGNGSSASSMQFKGKQRKETKINKFRINCSYSSSSSSSSLIDPYKTLRIQRGASESEVRKAFRQLALQYHPDVCRGNNCGVPFHKINEAYDIVMENLRGESNVRESYSYDGGNEMDETFRGMNDPDWDMWEEWMGWEGAGIRDYSSHINPYI